MCTVVRCMEKMGDTILMYAARKDYLSLLDDIKFHITLTIHQKDSSRKDR